MEPFVVHPPREFPDATAVFPHPGEEFCWCSRAPSRSRWASASSGSTPAIRCDERHTACVPWDGRRPRCWWWLPTRSRDSTVYSWCPGGIAPRRPPHLEIRFEHDQSRLVRIDPGSRAGQAPASISGDAAFRNGLRRVGRQEAGVWESTAGSFQANTTGCRVRPYRRGRGAPSGSGRHRPRAGARLELCHGRLYRPLGISSSRRSIPPQG